MGTGVSASYRYDGTISEAQWAVIGSPHQREYVEGCAVTAGTGTREVDIASGTVWTQNGYDTVSGATLTLAENTSGQPRKDYICAYVNYTTNDTALVAVTGTPAASPSPPVASLSRTAGIGWHVPLAEVDVASGVGVLSAGAVRDVRPGPWIEVTPTSPWSNYGGDWDTLAYRKHPDGRVELKGLVKTASALTSPLAQRFMVLPVMWRPAKDRMFAVIAKDVGTSRIIAQRVDVQADGEVLQAFPDSTAASSERWVSLSGITFSI